MVAQGKDHLFRLGLGFSSVLGDLGQGEENFLDSFGCSWAKVDLRNSLHRSSVAFECFPILAARSLLALSKGIVFFLFSRCFQGLVIISASIFLNFVLVIPLALQSVQRAVESIE